MLELINVMFPIMFIIVVGIIIFSLVRGIITWNKNNQSPRLTVSVVVAAKRENITHHQHANVGDLSSAHGFHTTTSTSYYVTFLVESGDRIELCVSGTEYEMIAILSDREEIIKKKEMEQSQAVINEIYRNGL